MSVGRDELGPLVPDETWRRDFPYTSAGEDLVTRRDFTRYLAAASGAFALGSLGAAVVASIRVPEGGAPQLVVDRDAVPEGDSYLFRYPTPDDPAILVHLPGGELRAYSQRCTHLGCVVFWKPERNELVCPCHEGSFDPATGDPIAGPPDRPLARIAIDIREGTIWATEVES